VASYLYGSVATGRARLGSELTAGFESSCRGVEIAAARAGDLAGTGEEAYGMRVFVTHPHAAGQCAPHAGRSGDHVTHTEIGVRSRLTTGRTCCARYRRGTNLSIIDM
jgi:hypothetical protein